MSLNSDKSLKRQPLYSSKLFPFFLTLVLMFFVFGTSAFIAFQTGKTRQDQPPIKIVNECVIGGCNNEICSNSSEGSKPSICLYSPKFECYKNASCEVQSDGKCGWTQTEELLECLSEKQNQGEEKFCGGIAGIACPQGFTCKLDGNYPDAGGKCTKN